jgi:tetratricopeptide (TPR) repeat protein
MKTSRFILILALLTSLGILMPGRAAVPQQTAGELFEKALYVEEGQGDLQKAIGIYQDLLKRFPDNGAFAAKAQLRIGFCYEKLGIQREVGPSRAGRSRRREGWSGAVRPAHSDLERSDDQRLDLAG